MSLIHRRLVQIVALAALGAGMLSVASTTPALAASQTPAWTCTMPSPTATPTTSASSSPSASSTATSTVTATPTAPPPPTPITPMLQIAGDHFQIDETRTLLSIQIKTPAGVCLSGKVMLWIQLNGVWQKYGVVTIPSSGTAQLWVAERSTTLWRAYEASTPTRNAVWSTFYILHNIPPRKPVVTPSYLPRPAGMARQGYAVGHGANVVVTTIPDAVWNQMNGVSWHPGCPVGRNDLRYATVNYWGFDGYRHRGELILAARVAGDFIGAFNDLYANSIPLRGVYRVDVFGYSSVTHGGNDYASMAHDNTSAFNCRWVDGSPGVLSPHAYGTAIDLNTYENPYDSATGWTPDGQWAGIRIDPYAWRATQDKVVAIMRAHGFSWTYGTSDPQHFDAH